MSFYMGTWMKKFIWNLPQGYSKKGEYNQQLVCKLQKSIYGFKQASRQWYSKLSQFLLKFGFIPSKSDYSLFTKGEGLEFVSLLVYVDDIIIVGPTSSIIDSVKTFLHSQFNLKDLGDLRYFLGLEIVRLKDGIFLTQH